MISKNRFQQWPNQSNKSYKQFVDQKVDPKVPETKRISSDARQPTKKMNPIDLCELLTTWALSL